MRVLHIVQSLSPLRGGPSFSVPAMTRGLARLGVDVDLAATDGDGGSNAGVSLGRPLVRHGVTYRYFRRQTELYAFSWPLTLWLGKHLRSYDIVHVHGLFSYPPLAGAELARRYSVPYVVQPLGTLCKWGLKHRRPRLKGISLRLVEGQILEGAAAIHFASEKERSEAAELELPAQSGVVIPVGVEMDRAEELPRRGAFRDQFPGLRDRFLLLFVGRLHPIKGLDLLLPAFAEVHRQRPDAMLVIAGEGERDWVVTLKEQSRRLGIEPAVLWTGFLSGTQKLAAFVDSDLFVLPSYSESFGLVVLEALSCGLPTVISEGVALSTPLSQRGGVVVTACDAKALAAAILQLMADPNKRGRLRCLGPSIVQDSYTTENSAEQLLTLYERILDRRRWKGPRCSDGKAGGRE